MKKLIMLSLATVFSSISYAALAQVSVRGLDHVAITVPDLSEAKSFFVGALGCKQVFDLGPFKDDNGNWMADNIGTHPRAVMNIGIMRCGNASTVELMEINSPSQNKEFPARDDLGASSLGFYTDDLEGSIDQVKSAGGTVLGSITSVEQGPEAGRRFIYTKSPWGQLIFLLNDGDGIAYSKNPQEVPLFSTLDYPADE